MKKNKYKSMSELFHVLFNNDIEDSVDLLYEEFIAERNRNLLFKCVRFINKEEERCLIYYEAWRDLKCYEERTKAVNGQITCIGFFFQTEEQVIKKFNDCSFYTNKDTKNI